jgi:hypothetical protein
MKKYQIELNGTPGLDPHNNERAVSGYDEACKDAMGLLLALIEGEPMASVAVMRGAFRVTLMVQHHGGVDTIEIVEV